MALDLISFDVFDTLLCRRIEPPDQVKVPAARHLSRWLAEKGVRVSISECLESRSKTEQQLRKQASEAGHDPECHIDDLFAQWVRTYLRDPEASIVSEKMLKIEGDAEWAVLYPVPGMARLLTDIRGLKKKTVLISDMYLGKAHIENLLERNGYQGLYDQLYVSSELKYSKGSGRLFEHVRADQDVSFQRWAHVGDSLKRDVLRPRRMGIKACHFHYPPAHQRKMRQERIARLTRVHPQWSGAQWSVGLVPPKMDPLTGDLRYALGFHLLGPLLLNFLHQVADRVYEQNIDLVLFPAREGFLFLDLFKKVWTEAYPGRGVRCEYAFLTRKALYVSSVNQLGKREIEMGLWSRKATPHTMLTRFGLRPEEFEEVARSCGIASLHDALEPWETSASFKRFITHPFLLRRLHEESRAQRTLVRAYLGQLGFWDAKEAAIVDVGWRGTAQDALTHAFDQDPHWPRLHGLYFGFYGDHPFREHDRSRYEGLFFRFPGDPWGRCAIDCFKELLELAAQAPHPTSVGFERDGSGKVAPVLMEEDRSHEVDMRPHRRLITLLQSGIRDYADVYKRCIPFQERPAKAYAGFPNMLLDRLLRLPKKEEALALSGFLLSEDFGLNLLRRFDLEPFRVWSPLSWWRLIQETPRALWPEGKLAATGVPGLVALANVVRMIRRRRY